MSLAIGARGITVTYGDHAVLTDLSVDFPEGRITTIIGPNGCGKSTLLRAVAQLIPTSGGTIEVGGRDARRMTRKELATTVAVLPQHPTAPPGLIVSDLVARGSGQRADTQRGDPQAGAPVTPSVPALGTPLAATATPYAATNRVFGRIGSTLTPTGGVALTGVLGATGSSVATTGTTGSLVYSKWLSRAFSPLPSFRTTVE